MISRKNGGVKILPAKMSGWLSHALLKLVEHLAGLSNIPLSKYVHTYISGPLVTLRQQDIS